MMKKIYVKPLNELLILDKPIIEIAFDNEKLYRNFSYEIQQQLIYSIDNQTVDLNKELLRISNPFDLEINNKKSSHNFIKRL